MKFIKTKIPEVVIIDPKVYEDDRGYFFESFSKKEFEENILKTEFIQDNESKSSYGVLRGLHYQLPPFAQSKLVRVILGKVLDVAVDIRKGSPTFGQHVSVELSSENRRQLFIPRGFAHGFVVLSKEVVFSYKVDNFYNFNSEASINYNDKDLNIDWKLNLNELILSSKDKDASIFSNAKLFDFNKRLY